MLFANIGGIFLRAALFFQSNEDFVIPMEFLVQDQATINGGPIIETTLYSANLTIDLVGQADPPTVFVNDASGLSLSNIPLFIGGELTDTDFELGRVPSEILYFIVSEIASFNMSFDYTVSAIRLCLLLD